jgi:hypothetical protein
MDIERERADDDSCDQRSSSHGTNNREPTDDKRGSCVVSQMTPAVKGLDMNLQKEVAGRKPSWSSSDQKSGS